MKQRFGLAKGAVVCLAAAMAGCNAVPVAQNVSFNAKAEIDPGERDCLLRAMYFESNRSSAQGLLAVGTVVMNRVKSGRYANTICGVVGQPGQFASGALRRKVSPREASLAENVADKIMEGSRLAGLERVMFFHTAGLHFHYPNMHYVMVAGGNAFYYRNDRHRKNEDIVDAAKADPTQAATVTEASATPTPGMTASAEPTPTVAATDPEPAAAQAQ